MKSHRIKSAITSFIVLMGIATAAYAQSAAEIGAMHNNCNHPNYQGDRSRCGGGNRAPAAEVWEDRFGAIAQDFDSGTGGIAENEKSKRAAEKLALKRCGNNRCKLVSSSRNSCQAAAWGGGVAFGGGGSEKIAKDEALKKCQSDGSTCKIEYVGCSLRVRVR